MLDRSSALPVAKINCGAWESALSAGVSPGRRYRKAAAGYDKDGKEESAKISKYAAQYLLWQDDGERRRETEERRERSSDRGPWRHNGGWQ